MRRFACFAAMAISLTAAGTGAARAQCLPVSITFTQTTGDSFLVSYAFDQPVYAVEFGRPVEEYRTQAWHVLTEGLELRRSGGKESLVGAGGASFQRASISVSAYSAYPSDQYVPMAFFSDGGVALHIEYFTGEALLASGTRTLCPQYFFSPLSPRTVVLSSQARETPKGFVYFGSLPAVELGHALLLADPAVPAWLDSTLRRTISVTAEIYRRGLPLSPKRKPLVMVAAGELDSLEGYSNKGGAVGDQVVFTIRGKALHQENPEVRAGFERLTAHELAHLWEQSADPTGAAADDPIITEGGCEALAVRALVAGGLWTEAQGAAFTEAARSACPEEPGEASPPEVLQELTGFDPYACGYLLFVRSGVDPFTVWSRMMTRVKKTHEGYTRALFEEVSGTAR